MAWRLAWSICVAMILVLIDRGFFSYGLFCRIQENAVFGGIRLKSGVRVPKVRSLGNEDELVCWRPKHVRQKERLDKDATPRWSYG